MPGRSARLAKAALRAGSRTAPLIELRIRRTTDLVVGPLSSAYMDFDVVDSDAFSGMFRVSDSSTVSIYRSGRAEFRFLARSDATDPQFDVEVYKLDSANIESLLEKHTFEDSRTMDFLFKAYVSAGDRIRVLVVNDDAALTLTIQSQSGLSPRLECRITGEDGGELF